MAAVIGGSIGVLEVALATELMVRNPAPRAEVTRDGAESESGQE